MTSGSLQPVTISISQAQRVSGLLQIPPKTHVCYVFAHGAGAGMTHPFMAAVAEQLAQRGIATLRYQFPYMERGSKRSDAPVLAQVTVRAAVAEMSPSGAGACAHRWRQILRRPHDIASAGCVAIAWRPGHRLPWISASSAWPAVERTRPAPLGVQLPMLFLQGANDQLADPQLLQPLVEQLGARDIGTFRGRGSFLSCTGP